MRPLLHRGWWLWPMVVLLAGCAAPKDSYKSFPRPKYDVSTHPRNGTPSVRQTWWKKAWFWQPNGGRKPHPAYPTTQ